MRITERDLPVICVLNMYLYTYVRGIEVFGFRFMVFNTTFNNISVSSWWSVLLVDETGVPGEPPTLVKEYKY
jgi:hypothetical protein